MKEDLTTIEGVEKAMAENRDRASRERAEIANDRMLSPEGKQNKLGRLQSETYERHESLKRAHNKAVFQERDKLYRRAFHKGVASIDSYRGVYSMASAAQDAKALERLKAQAHNTEDTLLRKAVQQAAYDKGHIHLLDLDDNPLVHELLEFEYRYGLRTTHDPVLRHRQMQARLHQALKITAPG